MCRLCDSGEVNEMGVRGLSGKVNLKINESLGMGEPSGLMVCDGDRYIVPVMDGEREMDFGYKVVYRGNSNDKLGEPKYFYEYKTAEACVSNLQNYMDSIALYHRKEMDGIEVWEMLPYFSKNIGGLEDKI